MQHGMALDFRFFGEMRLFTAVDEVVRRHMGSGTSDLCSLSGPGKMAVMAIEPSIDMSQSGQESDHQIGQNRFMGAQRIVDPQRAAFGAADHVRHGSLRGPFHHLLISALELGSWDFEANDGRPAYEPESFEAKLVVNFGRNTAFDQALLGRLRLGARAEEGDGHPVHSQISDDCDQKQPVRTLLVEGSFF